MLTSQSAWFFEEIGHYPWYIWSSKNLDQKARGATQRQVTQQQRDAIPGGVFLQDQFGHWQLQ